MGKKLSKYSDYVEYTSDQTTGAFDEVMRIDPSKKQGGVWFGLKPNALALMTLVQTNGTQLAADTEIRFGITRPNDNPRYFTETGLLYEPWYNINESESFAQQYEDKWQGQLHVPFAQSEGVAAKEGDLIIVEIKADNAIDWEPDSGDTNIIIEVDQGKGSPPRYRG